MKAITCLTILNLLLFLGSVDADCFKTYRKDVMEEWTIPDDSPLCRLRYTGEPSSTTKYFLNWQETYHIVSKELNREYSDNWCTEKRNDGKFSVSVYRPNLKFAHFLSIEITEEKVKQMVYIHSNSTGYTANQRSTLYAPPGSILRKDSGARTIMLWSLYGVFALLAITGIFLKVMNFGIAFMCVMIYGLAIATAFFKFTNVAVFAGILIAITVVAIGKGFLVWACLKAWVGIFLGFLLMPLYFFGGHEEQMIYFVVAFIILLMATLLVTWKIQFLLKGQKLRFVLLFQMYWFVQYLFWSFIFESYPAELVLRIMRGKQDYRYGVSGTGFRLWFPSLITLLVVIIFAVAAGLHASHKLKKAAHAGANANAAESKPLVDL